MRAVICLVAVAVVAMAALAIRYIVDVEQGTVEHIDRPAVPVFQEAPPARVADLHFA
jgi:hypothetical protein